MDQQFTHALAFFSAAPDGWFSRGKAKVEAGGQWIWETLQGDFNENQTTGQVVTGTVISMIPLVDQICDVRDLIANCRKINEDSDNTAAWVALALTLIGCIPVLGSFVKGAFKVMYFGMRKPVLAAAGKLKLHLAVNSAIKQLKQFLDNPTTQKFLSAVGIDNPYLYLSEKLREVMSSISVPSLLNVLDKLMATTRELLGKAQKWGPASISKPIDATLQGLTAVRDKADSMLGKALTPLNQYLEALAVRLHIEGNTLYRAHSGLNVHMARRLDLDPEEVELLLRKRPEWVEVNTTAKYKQLDKLSKDHLKKIERGWPDTRSGFLNEKEKTFHSMRANEIAPGEQLYRVLDPNSNDNSFHWMREKDFLALQSKAEWREKFAVWKSWNENGEYVVYTVPPGPSLKVWEGPAATQKARLVNSDGEETILLLQGGANQILLDPAQLKREGLGPRRKTGWGYRDFTDEANSFVGVPQLKTNWYGDN
ncbi:hypothetical protein VSX61_19155 [Brenneria populi subsp. brevivirga]|uniref:hypothetical protein n=1 Tax=Brenneria populi TaxID=1505588 RepID=UPI002E192781|nr:hypothetical protein [Brenneria populi subsp. brevivirga]